MQLLYGFASEWEKIFPYRCTNHTMTSYFLLVRNRGSYMSAHVLLNLLNKLGKEIKCEACRFYLFFAAILVNSIIQEHEC